MRLIDADALTESIKECIEVKDANYEWEQVQGLECALECIDEELTVQPVVQCKDCVWLIGGIDYPLACGNSKVPVYSTYESFGCVYGKRKGADNV